MKTVLCLTLLVAIRVAAQTGDDELRAVVVLARHGVRAPLASEIRESKYNGQPWPEWADATGVLTQHGTEALRLMGSWFSSHYPEIFLQGKCVDHTVYAEANTSQRTVASAKAVLEGMECNTEVAVKPTGQPNPLFGPGAMAGKADPEKLAHAIRGRLGGNLTWWSNAFANPLKEMSQVIAARQALPPAVVEPAPGRGIVTVDGAVAIGADFAEHFLLQYTEGFPMEKVGWGRVSRAELDRLMEMNTRYHDFVLRTPYYAQIAGSDLAFRIKATFEQAAGKPAAKALGTAENRFVLLDGHDSNLTWLGGLLRMDWLLPDQTFNATTPGSALVFELHKSRSTGDYSVRALFVSQTLDQIRYLKPLKDGEQPAIAPIFIPGCSGAKADFSCTLTDFSRTVDAAVDRQFIE
jgi:4-phytase/acid phosphatase